MGVAAEFIVSGQGAVGGVAKEEQSVVVLWENVFGPLG